MYIYIYIFVGLQLKQTYSSQRCAQSQLQHHVQVHAPSAEDTPWAGINKLGREAGKHGSEGREDGGKRRGRWRKTDVKQRLLESITIIKLYKVQRREFPKI